MSNPFETPLTDEQLNDAPRAYKIQNGQPVRILLVALALPASASLAETSDEISALLTENGSLNPDSLILDWQYADNESYVVTAPSACEEGEIFEITPDPRAIQVKNHRTLAWEPKYEA